MRTFSLIWSGIGCFATVAITVLGGVILANGGRARAAIWYGKTIYVADNLGIESINAIDIVKSCSISGDVYHPNTRIGRNIEFFSIAPNTVTITLNEGYIFFPYAYKFEGSLGKFGYRTSVTYNRTLTTVVISISREVDMGLGLALYIGGDAKVSAGISGPSSNTQTRTVTGGGSGPAATVPAWGVVLNESTTVTFDAGKGHYLDTITVRSGNENNNDRISFVLQSPTDEQGSQAYSYQKTGTASEFEVDITGGENNEQIVTMTIYNIAYNVTVTAATKVKIGYTITSHISMEE
jgi:hypothetical protein